jgi:hypothetical protein
MSARPYVVDAPLAVERVAGAIVRLRRKYRHELFIAYGLAALGDDRPRDPARERDAYADYRRTTLGPWRAAHAASEARS